jgi:hypothetical protein
VKYQIQCEPGFPTLCIVYDAQGNRVRSHGTRQAAEAWVAHVEQRDRDLIQTLGCCEQAERLRCVCLYAFRCPVHGDTHIRPHD